jgi:FAD/FMN-containing dehydrogenase
MVQLSTVLYHQHLESFLNQFRGQIIQPDHAEYETARRVWNGVIDKYPALIVRPVDHDDVVLAVKLARESNLLLSVRGGGHNVAGHATNDGGLVIDMSSMKQIEVDPVRRIARAQGGVTWGELDAATQVYGLAAPGGVFSKTGIAGLTLGGGLGWLRNTYGLSCDNLIGAEVVTADGQMIHATSKENTELLWGLRGGGGNFGVVTTFEYQLHPVGPEVMFVFAFHEVETQDRMKESLRFFRDFCDQAPLEVNTIFAFGMIPPEPDHFPVHLHGRRFALFGAMYAGAPEDGKRVLQPLLDFGEPMLDANGVKPYIEVQQTFDHDYPDGMRYYWKSLNLQTLDEAAIDRIVDHAARQVSPYSTTDLWHIGGAVRSYGTQDSAFFGRNAAYVINPEANWIAPEDDDANIAWVRDYIAAMADFSDGSRYLNFAGFQEEGDDMMHKAFASHYERLSALKQKYDPQNLFRLNQNVKPE